MDSSFSQCDGNRRYFPVILEINLPFEFDVDSSDWQGKQTNGVTATVRSPQEKDVIFFWNLEQFEGLFNTDVLERVHYAVVYADLDLMGASVE